MKNIFTFLLLFFYIAVKAQVQVNATAATTGPITYTTVKSAFDAINAGTHQGVINLVITANTTETATATLNASGNGSTSYTSVNIKPQAGTSPVITGNVSSGPIIKLNGSRNVTIDGSNNSSVSRNLTIANTSTSSPNVLLIGSTGSTPISNVTVKNCIVINGTNTSTCVVLGDAGALGSPGYFNNITIQNNSIQKAYIGLYCYAVVAANNGNNTLITENDIDAVGANAIRFAGIYVQGLDGVTVSNNSIGNFEASSLEFDRGIWFATATKNATLTGNTIYNINYSGTSSVAPIGLNISPGITNANITVANNTIQNLSSSGTGTTKGIFSYSTASDINYYGNQISNIKNTNTGGYGAAGLILTHTISATAIKVYNNFIWDVAGYGFNDYTSANNGNGIVIDGGAGYDISFNSVVLNTNATLTGAHKSSCLLISANVTAAGAVTLRNNILANLQTVGNASSRFVLSNLATSGSAVFSNINYNSYYATSGNLSSTGNNTSITNTIAQLQTSIGGNANSVNVNPILSGADDLHLLIPQPQLTGIPIAGINTDIDGETRHATSPYMGADEYRKINPSENGILYVKKDANGYGIGNSWENAIPELADALVWANNNKDLFTGTAPLQIWVARGTYNPLYSPEDGAGFGTDKNRDNAFLIVNNVSLYGGFTGTETSISQRDLSMINNKTILSGDLNSNDITANDDVQTITGNNENTYHILIGAGSELYPIDNVKINGFTITGGNANNSGSIIVNDRTINRDSGGGIYIVNYSSPELTNVTISKNKADYQGGGIYNDSFSSPKLINVTISKNKATIEGGGIYNGYGGYGILLNCTLYNNTPQEIYSEYGWLHVYNSILWNGTYGNNFHPQNNFITGNGLNPTDFFINPANDDYTLKPGSPAIDTGDNQRWIDIMGPLNGIETDLIGNPRIFNTTIDMGAYENQCDLTSTATQINLSCNGGSNGSATVHVTGGTGAYTYLWSPSGGNGPTATGLAAGTYTVTVTDANSCTTTQSFTITQPDALTAAPGSQTNASCNGGSNGSATVNVTGGTGAYTYLWSPSGGNAPTASGLAAGTYTVTVTDANNCSVTQSFTITEPAALTATPGTQNHVSCNGGSNGSATVSVTGGTGTYTYVWSPSGGNAPTASGLAAGTYTVTVTDANNCSVTQSFTITEPAALTATPGTQNHVSCNGGSNGSVTVNVTGGTGAYTYVWSPSGGNAPTASGLAAGTYTVTVTDANNCSVTQSFTITEPAALTATPGTQNHVSCNGGSNGSATVNVTGGTGTYTYVWSPSGGNAPTASGLAAGTYTVTVTDANNCSVTQSFTITEPDAISTDIIKTDVLCSGGGTGEATVLVSGGVIPYTYLWNDSTEQTTATASNLTAGTYNVTISDANNCTQTAVVTIAEPAVLTAAAELQTNASCYGESDGSAHVMISGGTAPYYYLWNTTPVQTTATAHGLPAGDYEVTVTDANGCTVTQSFIITEPPAVSVPEAANQIFCIQQNAKVADLAAVGTDIKWYNAAAGGNSLNTATTLVSGTYYASQTINGCESKERKAVLVTVHNTPPPTALSTQLFCYTSNPRISNIAITGNSIIWYNSATNTTPVAYNTLLVNGSTYYASQTLNGCESPVRTPVTIQINSTIPPAPHATTQSFCYQAKIADLVVTGQPGGVFKWYNSATSVTPLNQNQFITDGIYYVEQMVDQCISPRKAVQVYVTSNIPPANIQPFYFCQSATVADLYLPAAANTSYKWYVALNSIQNLSDNAVLQTATYYVSKIRMGCESSRVPVQVTIETRPATPSGATYQIFDQDVTIANLDVLPYNTTKWYATEQDALYNNSPLAHNTPLADGLTYYGSVVTPHGCTSIPLPVTIRIDYSLENEKFDKNRFVYFPNPVTDRLTIKGPQMIQSVKVYNLIGQQVFREEYNTSEITVPFENLAAGSYMVLIKDTQSRSFIKIIKK